MAMIPPEARGKLEPAEVFHEVLVHRWYLSERAGREVSIFETARDYIDNVLKHKPDELVTPVAGAAPEDTSEIPLIDALSWPVWLVELARSGRTVRPYGPTQRAISASSTATGSKP